MLLFTYDLFLCHEAKKLSKFREWLDCSSLDLKPNGVSMEILSYLAYETVAQVSCWLCFCNAPSDSGWRV